MKKLLCLALAVLMSISLCSCGAEEEMNIGSGEPGVVAPIDWAPYDELMAKIKTVSDIEERSLLMHQAEEMILETYGIIPFEIGADVGLIKPNIKGMYYDKLGNAHFTKIEDVNDPSHSSVAISLCSDLVSLDGVSESNYDLFNICPAFFAGLTQVAEDGSIACDLAESYEMSEDGCTYVFHMRDDIKWSNGRPITAKDCEYTFKRNASSAVAGQNAIMFQVISGYPDNLEVYASEDGKDFTVHLNAPCPYFLSLCAQCFMGIIDQETVESAEGYKDSKGNIVNPFAWGTNAENVNYSGAYTVESWKRRDSLILVKNPYYYDAANIPTERIKIMLNEDGTTVFSAYLAGDIQVAAVVPLESISSYEGTDELWVRYNPNITYVTFNVQSDLFAGMTKEEAITFRKAIACCLDRQFSIDAASAGYAKAANVLVPKEISDGTGRCFGDSSYEYPIDGGYMKLTPDLDEARRLLSSIGYEFGDDGKLVRPITIKLSATGSETSMQCIQADLAQLGINVKISVLEYTVFYGNYDIGDFEMTRAGWIADYDDPCSFLDVFLSESTNNSAGLGVNYQKN